MDYYRRKRQLNNVLDNLVNQLKENKTEASVTKIILELTKKHEVSEKAIKERIFMLESVTAGMKIDGDVIKWE